MFFSLAFIPLCFFQSCACGNRLTRRQAGWTRHGRSPGWFGGQKRGSRRHAAGREAAAFPGASAPQGTTAGTGLPNIRPSQSKWGSDGSLLCSGNRFGNTLGDDRAHYKD